MRGDSKRLGNDGKEENVTAVNREAGDRQSPRPQTAHLSWWGSVAATLGARRVGGIRLDVRGLAVEGDGAWGLERPHCWGWECTEAQIRLTHPTPAPAHIRVPGATTDYNTVWLRGSSGIKRVKCEIWSRLPIGPAAGCSGRETGGQSQGKAQKGVKRGERAAR